MNVKLNRRSFLKMAGIASGTAVLAACAAPVAAPGDEPMAEDYIVNHWTWLSASDAEVWGAHIDNFNEAHAGLGIQIEKLEVSSNEYKTKVLAAAVLKLAGGAPVPEQL